MIIIVLLSSCTQKTLRFTTYQSKYNIKLPKGYALKKTVDYHGSKEYQAVYADSSVVYITDDLVSGGDDNSKAKEYGDGIDIKILVTDYLVLEGVHANGRYWKEQKCGNIVVGCFNVPSNKKRAYEMALSLVCNVL
ncbi:MAG: hypothetical protein EAZ55_14840 [Cytophagales bacterium]|nr:MAG: hypothetical protein EAZ55_14840 [Cytophagales bacterium]